MNRPGLLAALAAALSTTAAATSAGSKSTIGILVFDGFLTSDVAAPVEVFGAATKKAAFSSYEVIVVSSTREKTVRSEEGLRIVADKTIYDDLALDVLIVPSTSALERLVKNKDLVDFIKRQSQSASWTGSNCSGARLLGEAGVLDGKAPRPGRAARRSSRPRIRRSRWSSTETW
jgi:transcriptional regulator GlxA family with amidase domain